MWEAHIVLKSTLQDGSHEQIDMLDVNAAFVESSFLVLQSISDNIAPLEMGRFFISDIIGYWFEES